MEETERALRAATKYGETVIDPLALLFTLAMGMLILALPRRRAILPVILVAVFIPVAQRVVLGGLDFNMVRILLLFAFGRFAIRQEYNWIRLNTLDKTILGWVAVGALIYTIRHASGGALINRLGVAFDTVGVYFFVRAMLRNRNDLHQLVRYLEWAVLILAALMATEWLTGRNLLYVFGGVPEFTPLREGRLRCQGAFNHPILAGIFAASVYPICFGDFLYSRAAKKKVALPLLGMGGAVAGVVLSVSSGPAVAIICGVLGWGAWFLRHQMRLMRWSIAGALLALELVTKNPIWHLVIYLGLVGGSTSYHRYRLIQASVDHFGEWWLIGTRSTLHWGHFMHDLTNQYVLEGARGGIWTLALFITVLSLAYANVGRALKRIRRGRKVAPHNRRAHELFVFGFGVTLFVHTISFLSASYYGQMIALWILFLATLGALPQVQFAPRPRREEPQTAAASAVLPAPS